MVRVPSQGLALPCLLNRTPSWASAYQLAHVSRAAVHKQDGTPTIGTPDPVFLQRRQDCSFRKKPGKSCFPDATPHQGQRQAFLQGDRDL